MLLSYKQIPPVALTARVADSIRASVEKRRLQSASVLPTAANTSKLENMLQTDHPAAFFLTRNKSQALISHQMEGTSCQQGESSAGLAAS